MRHLRDEGNLATGLNYRVAPNGDEEIRHSEVTTSPNSVGASPGLTYTNRRPRLS